MAAINRGIRRLEKKKNMKNSTISVKSVHDVIVA